MLKAADRCLTLRNAVAGCLKLLTAAQSCTTCLELRAAAPLRRGDARTDGGHLGAGPERPPARVQLLTLVEEGRDVSRTYPTSAHRSPPQPPTRHVKRGLFEGASWVVQLQPQQGP
eukprot:5322392-Alexandrium_andersonii.AAC.1